MPTPWILDVKPIINEKKAEFYGFFLIFLSVTYVEKNAMFLCKMTKNDFGLSKKPIFVKSGFLVNCIYQKTEILIKK